MAAKNLIAIYHLSPRLPTIQKPEELSSFWMVVPLLKTKLQEVRFLNISGFQSVGIQFPTVLGILVILILLIYDGKITDYSIIGLVFSC